MAAAEGPAARFGIPPLVVPSWSDDDIPLPEWSSCLPAAATSETAGPKCPKVLDLGPWAASGATPHIGGTAAQVSPEPETDDVDALSVYLEVIYVFSGMPSPSNSLFPSNPLSRQEMGEDLPNYDDRRGKHQSGVEQQPPRGGGDTHLVACLMSEAAEEEYHADSDVPEVDRSAVPARRAPSLPLNSDEVRDMHTMFERVFGSHRDGYASGLPGLHRKFRDFVGARHATTVAPACLLGDPSH